MTTSLQSSGSHNFTYKNTTKDGRLYNVNINVNIPEIGTFDMAEHIIFVVIPKEISLIDVRVNFIDNFL